jgi:hypothetical protein
MTISQASSKKVDWIQFKEIIVRIFSLAKCLLIKLEAWMTLKRKSKKKIILLESNKKRELEMANQLRSRKRTNLNYLA